MRDLLRKNLARRAGHRDKQAEMTNVAMALRTYCDAELELAPTHARLQCTRLFSVEAFGGLMQRQGDPRAHTDRYGRTMFWKRQEGSC